MALLRGRAPYNGSNPSCASQRLASEVVSEASVTAVSLPTDEMKGRLIGREGRNIRAIEAATGADLIIDDTPEAVTISCFDPIRREVARRSLERLIQDGRIHPARIEDVVERTRNEVNDTVRKAGEQALLDANVRGLHPELTKLVGRLKYRSSYGENVLQHSVENLNSPSLSSTVAESSDMPELTEDFKPLFEKSTECHPFLFLTACDKINLSVVSLFYEFILIKE